MVSRAFWQQTRPTAVPKVVLSLFLVALFVAILFVFFEPRWETNDDVGMSMVAHGYGLAAVGSPNLVFSNVIWGHLVRAVPTIGGMLGYSSATYAVIFIVGIAIVHGLAQLNLGFSVPIACMAIILVRPILFPQFTLNAGLLMVGSVICWHSYARYASAPALLAGCVLAFFSSLVRLQEFLLVLAIALPILPTTMLWRRESQISLIILTIAIAVAAIVDHYAYANLAWTRFNELNLVRAAFTDFQILDRCSFNAEQLKVHGFTMNDLRLVASWFFVDSAIADPVKLSNILENCSFDYISGISNSDVTSGFFAIFNQFQVSLSIGAIFLLIIFPSWRVVIGWLLFIAAILLMSFLGRPAVSRVYFPIICLLMLSPLLLYSTRDKMILAWRLRVACASLLLLAAVNLLLVGTASANSKAARDQQSLGDFPSSLVVVWGGAVFPFEQVYPVIGLSKRAISYRLYGLGAFTLAPFSVATAEAADGRNFKFLLTLPQGVSVVADESKIDFLAQYCEERLNGSFIRERADLYGKTMVHQVRCRQSSTMSEH